MLENNVEKVHTAPMLEQVNQVGRQASRQEDQLDAEEKPVHQGHAVATGYPAFCCQCCHHYMEGHCLFCLILIQSSFTYEVQSGKRDALVVGYAVGVSPFLEQIDALVVHQQVCGHFAQDWRELEAVARAAGAHQYLLLLRVGPVQDELIGFGDRVVAHIRLADAYEFLLEKCPGYGLVLFPYLFLDHLFTPGIPGRYMGAYLVPKSLPIGCSVVCIIGPAVYERGYSAELVLLGILQIQID